MSGGAGTENPPAERAATLAFVWIVFAIQTAIALSFVARYAGQVPFGDDYLAVPVLAGTRPLSFAWLWELDYGYRHVLPRLALFALDRISGHDLRAPRFASTLLLAALSAMLMLAARRARGRQAAADAFFPLLLLNLGHTRPLLQCHYILIPVSIAPLLVLLVLAVLHPVSLPFREAVVASASVILLPLCGGVGAAAAPPMAVWLGLVGVRQRADRGTGAVLAASAALSLALVGLYLSGYAAPPDQPPPGSPGTILLVFAQFLSMSIGPFGQAGWPFTLIAILLLVVATLVLLAFRWRDDPAARTGTAGIAFFLASMLAVAFSVAYGRTGHPTLGDGTGYGFSNRYTTIAAPLLAGIYLVWIAGPSAVSGKLQAVLFIATLLLIPHDTRTGIGCGNALKALEDSLLCDIRSGMSPARVAARHWPWFLCDEKRMALGLEIMRERGYGPYGSRAAP